MLTIKLEDLNRSKYGPLFLGNKSRLATATSVFFIDAEHIVTASLVGKKIYLFRIDMLNHESELVFSIDSTSNNDLALTDLSSYHAASGRFITTNFDLGTQSLYQLNVNNYTIAYLRDVKDFYPDQFQNCHGVSFFDEQTVIATGHQVKELNFISLGETTEDDFVLYKLLYLPDRFTPKDVAVIDNKHILVCYTDSVITFDDLNKQKRITRVVCFNIDLTEKKHKVLSFYDIRDSHCDCIDYYQDHVFVSNQMRDVVDILTLHQSRFSYSKSIGEYLCNHGLSYYPAARLLAVTCYEGNEIKIQKITLPNIINAVS